jgi:ribA/ribD-fused uncharacterized protein
MRPDKTSLPAPTLAPEAVPASSVAGGTPEADAAAPAAVTRDGFRGPYAFCSNFHLQPFAYLGLTFRCSEAAFQAAKFTDPAFRAQFVNLDGKEAKRLGQTRHPSFRPAWDDLRISEMRLVLAAKFSDPSLRDALLRTGPTELVEVNTWRDTFWGVCGGKGANHLGKLLMELRASLAPQG